MLDVGGFDLSRAVEIDPQFLLGDPADHQHDTTVTSVGFEQPGELAMEALNAWLGQLLSTKGVDTFRSKGALAVAGMAERYVFQGVHMLFDGTEGEPWGDAPRTNKLVFIGRNLDRDELAQGLRACLVAA